MENINATHERNGITVYFDDFAYTYINPLSGEHENELMQIYEDAYGDMSSSYIKIPELKRRKMFSEEVINEISRLI